MQGKSYFLAAILDLCVKYPIYEMLSIPAVSTDLKNICLAKKKSCPYHDLVPRYTLKTVYQKISRFYDGTFGKTVKTVSSSQDIAC